MYLELLEATGDNSSYRSVFSFSLTLVDTLDSLVVSIGRAGQWLIQRHNNTQCSTSEQMVFDS